MHVVNLYDYSSRSHSFIKKKDIWATNNNDNNRITTATKSHVTKKLNMKVPVQFLHLSKQWFPTFMPYCFFAKFKYCHFSHRKLKNIAKKFYSVKEKFLGAKNCFAHLFRISKIKNYTK